MRRPAFALQRSASEEPGEPAHEAGPDDEQDDAAHDGDADLGHSVERFRSHEVVVDGLGGGDPGPLDGLAELFPGGHRVALEVFVAGDFAVGGVGGLAQEKLFVGVGHLGCIGSLDPPMVECCLVSLKGVMVGRPGVTVLA